MKSIVTVADRSSVALTTLARAKAMIGITDGSADTFLSRAILHLSQRIAVFCQRTLVEETISELFRLRRGVEVLRLDRYPVSAITAITQCDTLLADAAYEFDARSGLVWRLCNDQRVPWHRGKIVVSYTAGYEAPTDDSDDDDLDPDALVLEAQLIELLKRGYYALTRDPALKSKSVLNGILSYSLYDPSNADGALPDDICGALEPYVKHDR